MTDLPHNIQAEQSLLGAIFMNNQALEHVNGLKTEHFINDLHGRIFGKCQELIEAGQVVTPITIIPYFQGEERVGEKTVPQYIAMVCANATTVVNAPGYARLITELAARRDMMAIGDRLLASAADMNFGISELGVDAIEAISCAMMSAQRHAVSMTPDAALEMCLSAKDKPILTTGLRSLDQFIGGWQPGMFTIMAGRPGMGKTILASCTGRASALAGNPAVIFSLEMSMRAMLARVLADDTWNNSSPIPFGKIIRGDLTEEQALRVRKSHAEMKAIPLKIDTSRSLTVGQIAQKSRRLADEFEKLGRPLKLIIIDHMGKINPGDRYKGQKVNEVGAISDGLANLANELGDSHGTALVAMSQLNRSVETAGHSDEDKVPELHHLRDSGNLEQDARIVGALYRPAYYEEKKLEKCKPDEVDTIREKLSNVQNNYQIHLLKNDSGPTAVCRCSVDVRCSVIRDAGVCKTNYY
jgi:replicative DNA helicase